MLKVAIMGHGTVGSGVYDVFAQNAAQIAKAVGEEVEVKYVLDLRDFSKLSYADKFVTDFSVIENDPEVCVVAEVMGGVGAAYEFSKRCLKAGKSVCTSNKELVAVHGEELLALAKEHNVNYLFEASVGGGIPLIRPMMQCLAANQIEEICGILNGTTNYILSQMIHNGVAFDDALRQAQKMGYAENDPTADIEGHDACRKICILSDLAFGDKIDPDEVSCQGISGITLDDVAAASELGYVIKLIGRAKRTESGKIFAFVAPHLVPKTSPLACVEDVFNGILVTGNMVGEVMFYGQGAGKHATASAVVADMMDAIAHREKRRPVEWGDGSQKLLLPIDQLESAWYVRGEVPAELAAKTVAGAALTVPMTAAELRDKLPQAEGAMRVL
ncbi:homoserine dehydrogenase [Butyricicoccus pullicaecorum]|uniref:Homoserine dehydrogenase n=1 Tax=Butyricicoccus pullicaecorum TaxID=501571 RepID=A0A1Y4LYM3_9FIRM|nr:homoserine dehydrogenase [Butyricicoccus pullicaecorum]OUP60201.1 homoserine dehydrogenase [Butyricicoccus pullicaecorum]HJF51802.1 homoserine dehydrogenase [Butyricicoccus pullicaecorum]